ncbi:MAG: polysaccharide biosynthesis/export family protein [Acidobacteriaceae bacterium]|nr:polysaccharide biosynthesis/export family protein [Acidobacteriaceae bacterium]
MQFLKNAPLCAVALLVAAGHSLDAQTPGATTAPANPAVQAATAPTVATPASSAPDALRPNYILQKSDQIVIRAMESEELNDKAFRIDDDGFLNLPVIGRVKAAGMTVQQLEADIVTRLKEYIRNPQVMIVVTQIQTQPVYFTGLFKAPGIYQLEPNRTLLQMLTAVGGLQPDASRRIKITRRADQGPIPLLNAVDDPVKKTSTAEVNVNTLINNANSAEDIALKPYDIISVEREEQVFFIGSVNRSGAIPMEERNTLSVVQALSLVGGFTPDAKITNIHVLRPVADTKRRAQIDLNVKRVLEGKDNDFPLLPNDLVYVPRSKKRTVYSTIGSLALQNAPYIIFTLVR